MSALNPYTAFRLVITTIVSDPLFFLDVPDSVDAESIHIINEDGVALFVVVGHDGKILHQKVSTKAFSQVKDLTEVISGVGIFTSLEDPKPSHEAVVRIDGESIKLTVKERTIH